MLNKDDINSCSLTVDFRNHNNRSALLKLPFLLQKVDGVSNCFTRLFIKLHFERSYSSRKGEL